MSKSAKFSIALAAALIASNGWWAYHLLDAGISLTYARSSQDEAMRLASQALAILNIVTLPGTTRAQVLAAAKVPGDTIEPYEKLGFTWVGGLGLKFDANGRFIRAVAGEASAEQ